MVLIYFTGGFDLWMTVVLIDLKVVLIDFKMVLISSSVVLIPFSITLLPETRKEHECLFLPVHFRGCEIVKNHKTWF